MIQLFCLINTRKNPTREESSTIGREIGENYLNDYIPKKHIEYGGYIVQDGQRAPFWRINVFSKQLIHNLWTLARKGYIGKVIRTY